MSTRRNRRSLGPVRLSPIDHAIWQSADREEAQGQPIDFLAELTATFESSITAWLLIEDQPARHLGVSEDLTALGSISTARWLGDARVFRNDDPLGPFVHMVLTTQYEGVIVLMTSISASDDRWKRLARWIRRRTPHFAPVFLDEPDFFALGDALADYGPIEASRLTARDLSDGSSYTRGWPERKGRPRPTHREALAEARRLAVRSLTFHVGNQLLLQLRREAGATYYSGDFRLFSEVVVGALSTAASHRRRLLVGRERQHDKPAPRPLAVRTRGGTFAESQALFELIDGLERQRDTGVAVFHRNPYLHVAVTDYSDGSNFDVFVHDTDEVVVIPGYRATLRALARLTDYVGEHFAAIEVAEVHTPTPPTREDLLTTG